MARRFLLRTGVGETLLNSKLQILNGTGNRRPSIALSILTGRVAEQLSILENFYAGDPVVSPPQPPLAPIVEIGTRARRQMTAHTVYLSEAHVRDLEWMIDHFSEQQVDGKRVTRSAILRRAVEHLRAAVEADPDTSLLENE